MTFIFPILWLDMRLLLITLMIFAQTSLGAARDTSDSENCGNKGLQTPADASALSGITAIANVAVVPEHETERFKTLVAIICMQINSVDEDHELGTTVGQRIESLLLNYNGITKETGNYKKKLGIFFNKNKNYFICPEITPHYKAQHIFKRVIDTNTSEKVLFNYLLHPDYADYNIDVNAIEIVNGERETVIDYIQKVKQTEIYKLGGGFKSRVNALERLLVRTYGALPASKISKDS